MQIGGFDNDAMTIAKGLSDENMEKLMAFKAAAERLVSTYVCLIPEENSESKMALALKATKVGQLPMKDLSHTQESAN